MPKRLSLLKPGLRLEITLTLILKVLLIYCIWWLFFSNPVDEHLDDAQVHNAIFGTQPSVSPATAPNRNSVED